MGTKNKLPNLFVGPLGKAQLDAVNFTTGIIQSRLMLEVIDKLKSVEEILSQTDLSTTERSLAQNIKEDLEESILNIAMTFGDAENGENNENSVF